MKTYYTSGMCAATTSANCLRSANGTFRSVCLALGLLAGASAAQAVVVSGQLAFSASGFAAGAPTDPVTGSVSYSFDNAAPFFNQVDGALVSGYTVDVNLLGLNLPGTWVPVLTYIQSLDVLAIGNGPTTVVTAGTDDWRFAVNNVSTIPTFREFVFANSSIAGATFVTTVGSVTPVPEPSSIALLSLGLVAMVLHRRRR